jgi:hypothetical protein
MATWGCGGGNGDDNAVTGERRWIWKFYIHSEEESVCPVCGGGLAVIGSRKRKVIAEDGGKVQVLIIRRLRCRECRSVHHELPDTVIPYKRYGAQIIENILEGRTSAVICEESTIRRIKAWWASMRLYFENILASLREKYGVEFSARPTPREIVRAAVNANLWIHTRSAFLTG